MRLIRLLLLIVVLLALFGAPLNAQALDEPPTFELRSWTVDAGGFSYGSGGAYSLGATAGQPDAAPPRGEGNYILLAGFWRPSCAALPVQVTIRSEGADARLTWTHDTGNQVYVLHRSTEPYFTPSTLTREGQANAAPWEFLDPGVLDDPGANYYMVRPACGAAWTDTNRVAEFSFTLTPGS
jgi:hypothetical protein